MKRKSSLIFLLLGIFLLSSCITMSIGKKPVTSMTDVKQLQPEDLADFAISLYNKRADWYKAQMKKDVAEMSIEEKKMLIEEYSLLTTSWATINSYDLMVRGGQVSPDLQIQVYDFIQKYLGGN